MNSYCPQSKITKMRKGILNSDNEPTDEELSELMHEVTQDVKRKALITKEKLAQTIALEIEKAEEKFNSQKL
jgi:hypothetical protein